MPSLVLVESEEKAKSLHDQSDGTFETLVLRSLPVKISHDAKDAGLHTGLSGFHFAGVEEEKELLGTLLSYLDHDIYLALDSDRIGEFRSWMIACFLYSSGAENVKRIHISGFTQQEIAESFRRPCPVQGEIGVSLYIRSLFNSCLTGHLHRLLGTGSGPGGLQLQHQTLTILFLLQERETEIASFPSPVKWRISVRLALPKGDFSVVLKEADGLSVDGLLGNVDQVKKAVALFGGRSFWVNNPLESDFALEPPQPYLLSPLLHDGFVKLSMGPLQVMHVLKKLYSGVEIDGKCAGLITAPFSHVPVDHGISLKRIRQEVEAVFGKENLVERTVEEGCILPLIQERQGFDLTQCVSRDEEQLYELIRCRALASQMGQARGRSLEAEFAAGSCLFHGKKSLLMEKGFLAALPGGCDGELLQNKSLPELESGQKFLAKQILPEQISTGLVENYTITTLLDDLLDFSPPVESPVIVMLQDMIDKGYVSLDAEGGFHCQANTAKVVAIMERVFPKMKGINLSAYFEQTVAEVVSGRKPFDFAMKQFDQNCAMQGVSLVKAQRPNVTPLVPLRTQRSKNIIKSAMPEPAQPLQSEEAEIELDEALQPEALPVEEEAAVESAGQVEEAEQENVKEDDAENALEVEDEGPGKTAEVHADVLPEEPVEESAGKTAPVEEPAVSGTMDIRECPQCGRPLLLKNDRYGQYWACSGYPACRHTESFGTLEEKLDRICPLCEKGSIKIERTPTGKKMYACSGRDCEFMAWSMPHSISCPDCSSPFLVEKKLNDGSVVLRCPQAGCNYQQPLHSGEGDEPVAEETPVKKKKILVRRKKGSSDSGKTRKVVVRRKK